MIKVNVLSEEKSWSQKIKKKEFFFNQICRHFPKKFRFKNKKFYNAKNIQKAYLTDFFNFLIEREIKIRCIKIKNNWMEIDTVQDLSLIHI